MIIYLITTTVLYVLICLYEVKYEDLQMRFEFDFEKKQRRIIRNAVGAVLVATDVCICKKLYALSSRVSVRIVFFLVAIILILHIINSIFALLGMKKVYSGINAALWVIRFVAGAIMVFVTYMHGNKITLLYYAAGMFIVCRQLIMVLDGDWIELRLKDFDKDTEGTYDGY